jgi:hypothetical protein
LFSLSLVKEDSVICWTFGEFLNALSP